MDSSNILYVTMINDIAMFDVDGECLGRIMIPGEFEARDTDLYGIAVDDQGQIYVCDSGRNEIVFINNNY